MQVRVLGRIAVRRVGGMCRTADAFSNRHHPISNSAGKLMMTQVFSNANYLFLFQPVVSGINFGGGF